MNVASFTAVGGRRAFDGVVGESAAGAPGVRDADSGFGDAAIWLKYRPIIRIPIPGAVGDHLAYGRDTHERLRRHPFRTLTLTEGLLVRKNLQPFRTSAGIFYGHSVPSRAEVLPGGTLAVTGYAGET